MSRAAFTYKSKRQLQKMGVKEMDAYVRTLEQRAKIGGYVTKSAEKQLQVASKVRVSLVTKALTGPSARRPRTLNGS